MVNNEPYELFDFFKRGKDVAEQVSRFFSISRRESVPAADMEGGLGGLDENPCGLILKVAKRLAGRC